MSVHRWGPKTATIHVYPCFYSVCNLTVYIVIVDLPVASLFCSVYFFFHIIHLLCVFLLFCLSLITRTIFIGGTITTIGSLFNY